MTPWNILLLGSVLTHCPFFPKNWPFKAIHCKICQGLLVLMLCESMLETAYFLSQTPFSFVMPVVWFSLSNYHLTNAEGHWWCVVLFLFLCEGAAAQALPTDWSPSSEIRVHPEPRWLSGWAACSLPGPTPKVAESLQYKESQQVRLTEECLRPCSASTYTALLWSWLDGACRSLRLCCVAGLECSELLCTKQQLLCTDARFWDDIGRKYEFWVLNTSKKDYVQIICLWNLDTVETWKKATSRCAHKWNWLSPHSKVFFGQISLSFLGNLWQWRLQLETNEKHILNALKYKQEGTSGCRKWLLGTCVCPTVTSIKWSGKCWRTRSTLLPVWPGSTPLKLRKASRSWSSPGTSWLNAVQLHGLTSCRNSQLTMPRAGQLSRRLRHWTSFRWCKE